MYFETIDLCKKLEKLKHKMSIIRGLKFEHLGTSSSNKKFNNEILVNRNWHFSWSKFYFYKKNNNYFYALRKISPNIFRSLIRYFYSRVVFDTKEAKLNGAILSGIFNAILLRKSFYRPNIK